MQEDSNRRDRLRVVQQPISLAARNTEVPADPWDDEPQDSAIVPRSDESLLRVMELLESRLQLQPTPILSKDPKPNTHSDRFVLMIMSLSLGTMTLCVGLVSAVLYLTNPTRQMTEFARYQSDKISGITEQSLNAIAYAAKQNSEIAKVASKERSNNFSLINWGGSDEPESVSVEPQRREPVQPEQPEPQRLEAYPVWFQIQGNNLNLRDSPDGGILYTMPIGDKISYLGENQGEWYRVRWIESNVDGWIHKAGIPRERE